MSDHTKNNANAGSKQLDLLALDDSVSSAQEKFSFGLTIAKRRIEMQMTQDDLANRSGQSRSSIIRIENEAQIPKADTMIYICDALEASPNMMFPAFLSKYEKEDNKFEALKRRIEALPEAKRNVFFQSAEIFLRGLERE